MNPQTVLTVSDQSGALQVGQMARHLRLIGIERVNQMADADFAFSGQEVDQPQPRLVGAGPQERGHLRQQLVSRRFFSRVATGSRHTPGIISEEASFCDETVFVLTYVVGGGLFSVVYG